jgi:hypothetical protein
LGGGLYFCKNNESGSLCKRQCDLARSRRENWNLKNEDNECDDYRTSPAVTQILWKGRCEDIVVNRYFRYKISPNVTRLPSLWNAWLSPCMTNSVE